MIERDLNRRKSATRTAPGRARATRRRSDDGEGGQDPRRRAGAILPLELRQAPPVVKCRGLWTAISAPGAGAGKVRSIHRT